MNKQKSIKKNIFMSMLLTTSNFVFPLITYSYVARVITPVGTGRIAFVQSVLGYFSHIAMLGIPNYGLRECARVRDDKEKLSHLVQELLILNILFTVLAYCLLGISVLFIPKLYDYKDVFLVMSGSIFLSAIGLEWVYQALEEYTYITVRSLIIKCISVALTFVLIRSADDYLWYGFLLVFTSSASYVLNFANIKKHISFKKEHPYNFQKHAKPIFTFFMVSIVITVYANFDVSMLGFISTDHEVGLYSAASKIKTIVLSLSTAVTSVLVPRIGYCLQNKEFDSVNNLLVKSLRVSLLLCLPVAVYATVFAKEVLIFLCGSEYKNAASTMRVLTICVIPLILTNLFGNQILVPLGKEKRYSQSVFVGMWINLGLNMILIPLWGAFGAAIGTLATECWNVFWMSTGVIEYGGMILKRIKFRDYLFSLMISALVAVVSIKYVLSFHVLFQLMFTAIAYFGVYYVMLIIKKEPLLMQVLTRINSLLKNRVY